MMADFPFPQGYSAAVAVRNIESVDNSMGNGVHGIHFIELTSWNSCEMIFNIAWFIFRLQSGCFFNLIPFITLTDKMLVP